MNSITIQVDIIEDRNIARWYIKGLEDGENMRMVGNVPFIGDDERQNALVLAAHHAAIALQSHLIRRQMEDVKRKEENLNDQQRKEYGAELFLRIVKDQDSWEHEDIANIAMAPEALREEILREILK